MKAVRNSYQRHQWQNQRNEKRQVISESIGGGGIDSISGESEKSASAAAK